MAMFSNILNGETPDTLRVISVKGNDFYPFRAYLPYIRKGSNTYNYKQRDQLDEDLLQEIKNHYPQSAFVENRPLFWEEQLEQRMYSFVRPYKLEFILTLFPSFDPIDPYILQSFANKILDTCTLKLTMYLDRPQRDERDYITTYATVDVDHTRIRELASTFLPL